MVLAGIWQLDRHSETAARNEAILERSAVAPVELERLISAEDGFDAGESLRFRKVIATGSYQYDDEVFIRNRSFEGAPGYWVVTPLVGEGAMAAVVNRGWVPLSHDPDAPNLELREPPGEKVVLATIEPSRTAEGFQIPDAPGSKLTSLARVDVSRISEQVDYDLWPVVLNLSATDSLETGSLPLPLPLPALDGGPHLSYAVQWFIFATIAVGGYPLILRHRNRNSGSRPSV